MTAVGINGITGRMGEEVTATADERDDVTVTVGVAPEPDGAGDIPTYAPEEMSEALTGYDVDVLIDFSAPAGTRTAASACREAGVGLVVGTTGLDEEGEAALAAASEAVPVLQASNFARGIQALLGALNEALSALPGYDVEVLETHHNGKRDAPSGTAETILDAVGDHRTFETVAGREGIQPRDDGEVGMLVRRAGNVRGEHEVMLAGNDEVLTLTHRAEDRGVFAAGALDAAVWLDGRTPGEYDFTDAIHKSRVDEVDV